MILDDKPPPQNAEAEMYILGTMLRFPSSIFDVQKVLRTDDFFFDHHQKLYTMLVAMLKLSLPIELVAVYHELQKQKLEQDVTALFLARIFEINEIGPSGPLLYYAKIVAEKSQYRKLIHITTELLRDSNDEAYPPAEIIAKAITEITEINQVRMKDPTHISEAFDVLQSEIDARSDPTKTDFDKGYIPTQFHQLNEIIGGFRKSHLITVAARTSVGKSAFTQAIALNTAKLGIPTIFITMEMKPVELATRVVASESRIALDYLTGIKQFDSDKMSSEFIDTTERLRKLPFWIDQKSKPTVDEVAAVVKMFATRRNLGLAVVDYVGLINHQERRGENRAAAIGRTTETLKQLAMELDIPIIMVCQMNRAVEMRVDKRPQLSDLRESGSIEQDSNEVIFLWREDEDEKTRPIETIKISVAKQRNGKLGEFSLRYRRAHTQYAEGVFE